MTDALIQQVKEGFGSVLLTHLDRLPGLGRQPHPWTTVGQLKAHLHYRYLI